MLDLKNENFTEIGTKKSELNKQKDLFVNKNNNFFGGNADEIRKIPQQSDNLHQLNMEDYFSSNQMNKRFLQKDE